MNVYLENWVHLDCSVIIFRENDNDKIEDTCVLILSVGTLLGAVIFLED